MLVRLFRTNQPGILVLLLALVPLLFWKHLGSTPPPASIAMPLATLLNTLFVAAPWSYGVLVLAVIALLAVQLAVLMNEGELVDRRTHLVALLFPVILAALAPAGSLGAPLFGMPFLVWAMRRAWSVTSGGPALSPLFDAGFLVGVAAQFYMPFAFMGVVIWAGISVIRPFLWRDYLMPVLGLLLTFYLAWAAMHLSGMTPWRPLRTITTTTGVSTVPSSAHRAVLWTGLLGVLVVAMYHFAGHYRRGVVREQNLRTAFLAFALCLGLVVFLVYLLNGEVPMVLISVPLSMLCVFAFLGERRAWLSETVLFALLFMALYMQVGAA